MIKTNSQGACVARVLSGVVPLLAGALLLAGCSFSSPEQQVSKARQAYRQHDYHAAEVQLKSVLRKHPDNGAAWALLGHTSLASREYDDAIHQFKKARANGQPATAVALPLGRALVASGQYQQALNVLQTSDAKAPDHVQALIASLRGDAQAGLGHRDQAEQAYASALSIESGLPDALQGQARLALQRGDLKGAYAALSSAVVAHPDDVGSLLLLGQVDYRSNRCADVITRLNHAMQIGGSSMTGKQQQGARALLADCQLRAGDFDAAGKNIDALLTANQNNPYGNYLKALMEIRGGQYREAANHVQATLNVDPDNLRSMTLMAWIRIAQGRPDGAQPFLTRVLARAPDDVAAVRLQAGLWMAQNQDKQARALLEKTYQQHPEQPGLHKSLADVQARLAQKRPNADGDQAPGLDDVSLQLDLARSLAQMGSGAAAETILAKIKPTTADERRAVAAARVRIALAAGDGSGAVQKAEALVRNNPDSTAAHTLLAQSYANAGRYDDAANALQQAHGRNPDDTSVVRAQAELAARRGRYADAIDYLRPLHSAHPDDVQLTLALAGLYTRTDKTGKDIDLLQTALKRQPDSDALGQALARAWLTDGENDRALDLINDRLANDPEAVDWLHLKGVAQLMGGQVDQGIEVLSRAADQAPDQPEFALDVAKAELLRGQPKKAIERLRRIRGQSPNFWPAAGFLALAEAGAGNTDAALKQASDLRSAGHGYDADVLDGDVLRTAKRYKKADAAYDRAYREQPSRRLAVAMFETRRAGSLPDPAEPIKRWLKQNPDDGLVALRLADWQQQHGQVDDAKRLYRQILDKHPDSVVALNNLALLNADAHPQQALSYARKAHDKAPESAAVSDTLGWIMVGQKDLDGGIALLEKADKTAGGKSPAIRYHLGAALIQRDAGGDAKRGAALLHEALASKTLTPNEAERANDLLGRPASNSDTAGMHD